MKKSIFKFSAIFIIILPIFLFMHTGFLTNSLILNVQAIIFAAIFSFAIVWPQLKKYFFLISLFLLIGMELLFVLGFIKWADILGSSGIGIITIVLIGYVPQLLKNGYIESI